MRFLFVIWLVTTAEFVTTKASQNHKTVELNQTKNSPTTPDEKQNVIDDSISHKINYDIKCVTNVPICPDDAEHVCVKLDYVSPVHSNKTMYVVMVNRCQLHYLKCYNDIIATEQGMQKCEGNQPNSTRIKRSPYQMDSEQKPKKKKNVKWSLYDIVRIPIFKLRTSKNNIYENPGDVIEKLQNISAMNAKETDIKDILVPKSKKPLSWQMMLFKSPPNLKTNKDMVITTNLIGKEGSNLTDSLFHKLLSNVVSLYRKKQIPFNEDSKDYMKNLKLSSELPQ